MAVIDSGTHPHPDLRRNLLAGADEINASGDGRDDKSGHGTSMASLIASHGRSSNGMRGIAPAAKILPVRVSDKGNDGSPTALAKGIEWSSARGADVINVSLGTGPAFELEDSVKKALDRDIVVVAAVGNRSKAIIISYPAAFDGVLTVGAIGRNGKHAALSVKDARVQLCAPGVDLTTAKPSDRYARSNGTSGATAIVSGAAALVRAKFPRLSGKEVVHRLTATADDIGPPGRDDECGFGRLNIVKALTADVPPLEGSAPSNPPPSATTPSPTPAATSAAAAPDAQPSGNNSSVLVFGGLAGIAVAGGVVLFLALRRRRQN